MALGVGFHVIPLNDQIAHEPEPGCVCGPTGVPEPDPENPDVINFIFTHHALDGRQPPERKT